MLPPAYVLLALALSAALHVLAPIYRYWSFPWTLTGLVPLGVGVFLNLTADRQFKEHGTTVKPFQRSSALITTYPFSISRHPMYLGLSLMLFGVALLLGTLGALLPALAFPPIMDRLFVHAEEDMLAETFGARWDEYRSRVRRWI